MTITSKTLLLFGAWYFLQAPILGAGDMMLNAILAGDVKAPGERHGINSDQGPEFVIY